MRALEIAGVGQLPGQADRRIEAVLELIDQAASHRAFHRLDGMLGHELDTAVVFLASDASSYITGATLAVDGGMSGH